MVLLRRKLKSGLIALSDTPNPRNLRHLLTAVPTIAKCGPANEVSTTTSFGT